MLEEVGPRPGEVVRLKVRHVVIDDNGAVLKILQDKTGARRVRMIEKVSYLSHWLSIHPLP